MDDYELSMLLGESISNMIRGYRGCKEIMQPDMPEKIKGIDDVTKIKFGGLEKSLERMMLYLKDIDRHIDLRRCIVYDEDPPTPEEIYSKLIAISDDDKLLLADDAAAMKDVMRPVVMIAEIFDHLKQITELTNELKDLEKTDFL